MPSRTWAVAEAFVLRALIVTFALGSTVPGVCAQEREPASTPRRPATTKSKSKPKAEKVSLLKRLGFGSLIHGRVVYGLWLPTQTPEGQIDYNIRQSQLSAWLETEPKFTDSLSLHARGTVDGILQSTVITTTETVGRGLRATFREGYLQYSSSGWDLRAGRQLVLWGKSDGINPTDFLSAKRQYLLYSERRVGAWDPTRSRPILSRHVALRVGVSRCFGIRSILGRMLF